MSEEHRIQGVPVSRIADRFGTPLYLYDADVLRGTYQGLRRLLDPGVDIFYSLKANPNVSVCAALRVLGSGAEVCSLTELATALRAGVPPADIIYLGPAKSSREIGACVAAGIHAVVCESLEELRLVDEISRAAGKTTNTLIRVNPEQRSPGSALAMGGRPRQFGVDVSQFRDAGPLLGVLDNVRVTGIHVYLGSRFLDHSDIIRNTTRILTLADDLSRQLGFPLETVDIGGGFGVAYFDNEKDLDVEALATGIGEAVRPFKAAHPHCRLITELGRYLVADAGIYVIRAAYVKESMGEAFVVCDGGTNHHMHAVGIGSLVKRNFPLRALIPRHGTPMRRYTVTGPLCTPNDVIAKRALLPEVEPGDLLAVGRSGAYGVSASPVHFLGYGAPAEVLILQGEAHLIRQRETVEDLMATQRLITAFEPPSVPHQPVRGEDMKRQEIVQALRNGISAVLQQDVGELNEDLRLFDDLHLDSSSVLELLIELEDSIGLQIDPEELQMEDFMSVGTFSDFITARITAAAPSC